MKKHRSCAWVKYRDFLSPRHELTAQGVVGGTNVQSRV